MRSWYCVAEEEFRRIPCEDTACIALSYSTWLPRVGLPWRMIVENAERLGLAQLHQLRGRVGGGAGKSLCVLMYHSPLSVHARARLGVLHDSNDGLAIAQCDLELRGHGELLGTHQTGILQLRIADLARDCDLFPDIGAGRHRDLDPFYGTGPATYPALARQWGTLWGCLRGAEEPNPPL